MTPPIYKTIEHECFSAKYIFSESRTFLMGIAMISIILFHQFIVSPSGINIITIFHIYGHWGVDVFLFLSGFGCAYAMQKYTTKVFYRKRLLRILPTCLIVGVFIVLADSFLLSEVVKTYLPIRILSLHRWYIQAIVTLYLLAPLFYYIIKRWKATALFCLILLIGIFGIFICTKSIGCFMVNWIPPRTPIFLIGIYIGIHDLKLTKRQFIFTFLCFCLTLFTHRYFGNLLWPYFLAFAIPGICVCLAYLKKYCEKIYILKPIETMGIYSLEIYLIHEYLLWSLSHIELESPYSTIIIKVITFIVILIIGCKIVKTITSYLTTNKIFSLKF